MEEIRVKIATEAGKLFMQHGVKKVSMDEIASQLGMSKRTIYQQFPDKEEIIIFFMNDLEQKQISIFHELSKTMPTTIDVFLQVIEMHRDMDSTYCVRFYEDIEKYYPRAKKLMKEQRERGVDLSKNFIKKGITEGCIRNDLHIEVIAFLLQETNNTYVHAMRLAGRTFSIWDLFFTMMINFIRGISTQKGIKIVDEYLKRQKLEIKN